jgi:thiol-disulfide isomerase/thioredoxin
MGLLIRWTCLWLLAVALWPANSIAEEPELKLGDAAPKLNVGDWLKGDPVKEFEKDKVYVLEFWASWCGPCIKAMPKISKLQAEYESKGVIVIGVNVAEDGETDVADFVKKQGKKMAYRVVQDNTKDNENGEMVESWLDASGQEGIPVTFIVNQDGKIAWIGHPDELSKVLAQVVEKKWDLKKAQEEFLLAAKKRDELIKWQEKLQAAAEDKDIDKVLKIAEEMATIEPEAKESVPMLKFTLLLQLDEYKRAYAMSDALYEAYKDDSEVCNEISWTIMTDEDIADRDYDMAMKFAARANEVVKGEDPAILDTLARAHFEKNDLEKAIEFQTKAVEKAADDKKLKKELEGVLKKYKAKKAV